MFMILLFMGPAKEEEYCGAVILGLYDSKTST